MILVLIHPSTCPTAIQPLYSGAKTPGRIRPSGIKAAQGGRVLEVRVDDPPRAMALLKGQFESWRVSLFGERIHVIVDVARKKDRDASSEAMRQVGEIRAGKRPPPGPGDALDPTLEAFLALTGELSEFEADLAQSFGPEEAHRLAYSDEMCAGQSTFGGPGPRKP